MRLSSYYVYKNIMKNKNAIKRFKTGADIVYDKLIEKNVKDVFIYSGGSIMPLIDKLYNSPINYYVNRTFSRKNTRF